MSKRALMYFVIGVTLTTASYAFFADWAKMPMNMMQMTQPQQQASPLVCDCRCN
tara:strand:- start:133 stop:294 length:162 start_codon:yes stop_codon:yes gene_type:complete